MIGMAIVVTGIKTGIGDPKDAALQEALRRLKLGRGEAEAHIHKVSVDARKRGEIHFVSSVLVDLYDPGREKSLVERLHNPQVTYRESFRLEVHHGDKPLFSRPVVVGFGPAGMFAALLLAREGFRPIVLERGGSVEERVPAVEGFWAGGLLDPVSNVQFGEGGAGTFSDGKLTTRIGDPRCEFILRELAAHGAPEEILKQAKPHIGTDKLRLVVRSIREEILRLGGEIRFREQATDFILEKGALKGVVTSRETIPTQAVVLALGHSARDTFASLHQKGVTLIPKAFSVGVRAEQLQSVIDQGLYGDLAGHPALPVGEYQLSHRRGERGVYTFCMCPGGLVVPSSSEEGGIITNGMSEYARDRQNANAALVVSVDGADFGREWDAGIRFQRELEQKAYAITGSYRAPAETAGRFLAGKPGLELGAVEPSYAIGVEGADFDRLFPPVVTAMLREGLALFQRKLPGFGAADVVLTGPETRTSSPVRIPRGESLEAEGILGLYPCGEGAGYAGGIVSAAVDGLRVAQQIIAVYKPMWE